MPDDSIGCWSSKSHASVKWNALRVQLYAVDVRTARRLFWQHCLCLVSIRKTPHLLFHLFLCFSVLFSKKAEKVKKKAIPSTFFVVKLLRKRKKKVEYQMSKNGPKNMSKNG